jgi:hypothetical protein
MATMGPDTHPRARDIAFPIAPVTQLRSVRAGFMRYATRGRRLSGGAPQTRSG